MTLLRHSLVARITASLVTIVSMALISIVLTMTMTHSLRGDAVAINVAGSLRMNIHQLLGAFQQLKYAPDETTHRTIDSLMTDFEQRVHGKTLRQTLSTGPHHERHAQLARIQSYWDETLRPAMQASSGTAEVDLAALRRMGVTMVDAIEVLVDHVARSTEDKVRLMGLMQGVFLALIILVASLTLYDVRRNLVAPLRQLMTLARQAARRDFTPRSHLRGNDELALLGRAFNRMSAELATSYAALEDKASLNEQELERSNQALRVMHDASRALYGGGNDLCASAAPMLRELEEILDLGPIRLSLNDPYDQRKMPVLETHSPARPEYCRDQFCHACLVDPDPQEAAPHRSSRRLLLTVSVGDMSLGTLEVWYSRTRLKDSTRRLLTILADQIATAVYLQRRIEEQQHITLINERTIIARELHDSLAQSLSYLKMQVARLERMQQKEATRDTQSAVFGELRSGLNSAYRQLRELLTTFRLKLERPGLQFALRQTVEEFRQRIDATVDLDYDVPPYLLNPNEDIHVLQIIREALANVHKHAQAHWVGVTVQFADARLRVRVEDDGIGLKDAHSPPMHYGLVIIRDRASTLNGELTITNRPAGGTSIEIVFTPSTARLIQQQPAAVAPRSHSPTGTSQ